MLQKSEMEKTRLSNKGQIVIPKAVRILHGWKAGLEFLIEKALFLVLFTWFHLSPKRTRFTSLHEQQVLMLAQ